MAKSKQLTIENIDEARKGMEEEGYSPEVVKLWVKEAEGIEPGQDHLEYNDLIYIAVMPDD